MAKYPRELTTLLTLNRTSLQRKLHIHEDKELFRDFVQYCRDTNSSPGFDDNGALSLQVTDFLNYKINMETEAVAELRHALADFNQRIHLAVSVHEKQGYILAFAARMGADKRCLSRDRRAFRRWFGADTVIERCQRRISEHEYRIVDLLNRLGNVVFASVQTGTAKEQQKLIWERIDLEELTRKLLVYQGDQRVRMAAFGCLARGIAGLPKKFQLTTLKEATVTFIYRSAMASQEQIWIQCEALELLALIAPHSFLQAMKHRFSHPRSGDALFVRRRGVRLLGEYERFYGELVSLMPDILNDPSPFVRQALAEALGTVLSSNATIGRSRVWGWLQILLRHDQSYQVRAAAVRAVSRIPADPQQESEKLDLLQKVLAEEDNSFVLKLALDVAAAELEILVENCSQDSIDTFRKHLLPKVRKLHQHASDLTIRRWAALIREKMIVTTDPACKELKEQLTDLLKEVKPGKSCRVPGGLVTTHGTDTFVRVLAVLSQSNYSYSLHKTVFGYRICKGDTFAVRLWRLLHELRNPTPDKRQGYSHTVGRQFKGVFHCPSAILGELTQTKVPGEPLFMDSEGSWRPYIPLPDQILSCLQSPIRSQPVKLYTAEGVTEIYPPSSTIRRLIGAGKLTLNFSRYAEKRNWEEDDSGNPGEYISALKKLGVRIKFIPHADENGNRDSDSSVERFFLFPLPLMDADWYYRIHDYFFSVYENTLPDLAVFATALLLFFVGSRFVMSRIAIRSRQKLDLVIGGWGTRGKSGTERLKAALFEALGHSLVSKSTGCEAMFLYAYPFGKTREMFLFRPYDKATIWEQYDVVRLSTRLSTRVFLWECMALGPDYVRILQHQWMRDDYSTITNTYPDHEDIQGPAGYNIPLVMTEFIPKNGNLIATEEQMLPILESAAGQSGTKFQSVGWREAGMLAPDVLDRFPYEEHPYNIALVLAMAKELGIDPDFALKEMADRVIADIGVLKEYPRARVRKRDLQFVSGMSANERFGALSNWRRMGFDSHDPRIEPGIILSTVVNNRADRVSRSQMFARIIVEDFAADYHFLIGSNLEGLMGYIHESLHAYCQQVTLQPDKLEKDRQPLQILEDMARRQRVPLSKDIIGSRLDAMISGMGLNSQELPDDVLEDPGKVENWLNAHGQEAVAAEIIADINNQLELFDSYQKFYDEIKGAGRNISFDFDERLHQLIHKWFLQKIVVIEEYHATGEQIVNRICQQTPPGLLNRIMGLQNIKGTGLDFVYRWQAWESCHRVCEKLTSSTGADFERALHELSAFQEYGLLSESHVEKSCETVRESTIAQAEKYQAEIALILSNMKTVLATIIPDLSGEAQEKSMVKTQAVKLIAFIESMVDAGDAVRRRKRANRIYKDLAEERISGERAAKELKILNRRQKGGWLWSTLQRLLPR